MHFICCIKIVLITFIAGQAWGWIDRECADFSGQTATLDPKWLQSVPRWYFTLMSWETVQSAARRVIGKTPEQISPNEFIYQSCVSSEPVPGGFMLSAFGAKKFYGLKRISGIEVYEICPGGDGYCERSYTTLTDNKSFMVIVTCMSTGDMKWRALGTSPDLPEQTKKQIWDHVASLGFKRENFVELSRENCPPL